MYGQEQSQISWSEIANFLDNWSTGAANEYRDVLVARYQEDNTPDTHERIANIDDNFVTRETRLVSVIMRDPNESEARKVRKWQKWLRFVENQKNNFPQSYEQVVQWQSSTSTPPPEPYVAQFAPYVSLVGGLALGAFAVQKLNPAPRRRQNFLFFPALGTAFGNLALGSKIALISAGLITAGSFVAAGLPTTTLRFDADSLTDATKEILSKVGEDYTGPRSLSGLLITLPTPSSAFLCAPSPSQAGKQLGYYYALVAYLTKSETLADKAKAFGGLTFFSDIKLSSFQEYTREYDKLIQIVQQSGDPLVRELQSRLAIISGTRCMQVAAREAEGEAVDPCGGAGFEEKAAQLLDGLITQKRPCFLSRNAWRIVRFGVYAPIAFKIVELSIPLAKTVANLVDKGDE